MAFVRRPAEQGSLGKPRRPRLEKEGAQAAENWFLQLGLSDHFVESDSPTHPTKRIDCTPIDWVKQSVFTQNSAATGKEFLSMCKHLPCQHTQNAHFLPRFKNMLNDAG